MKKFVQAMRMDLCRALRSPLFYGTVLLLWGVWSVDQVQELLAPNIPVLYYFHWRSSGALLAALPFATSFCEDYRNRFLWYSIQRTNIRAYTWSKVFSSMLYTFLANMFAISGFVGILLLRSPLLGTSENIASYVSIAPYDMLLCGRFPILYFLCIAICESLFMGLLSTLALTISGMIPDYFVTLAAPIVCYYGMINTVKEGIFSPYRIFMTHSIDMGGVVNSLLYAIGYTIIGIMIMGAIFFRIVKRRVSHG